MLVGVTFVSSPGFFVLFCLKSFIILLFIFCVFMRKDGAQKIDNFVGVGSLLGLTNLVVSF